MSCVVWRITSLFFPNATPYRAGKTKLSIDSLNFPRTSSFSFSQRTLSAVYTLVHTRHPRPTWVDVIKFTASIIHWILARFQIHSFNNMLRCLMSPCSACGVWRITGLFFLNATPYRAGKTKLSINSLNFPRTSSFSQRTLSAVYGLVHTRHPKTYVGGR